MIYLVLSILSSTIIFIVFKLIKRYDLNTLQVIVINYITACLLGFYLSDQKTPLSQIYHEDWFLGALLLGVLFIAIFNVMALTAQKNGISVASVATKMSVAIPIVFGILMYSEGYGIVKLFGIVLALLAVYLTSLKSEKIITSLKDLWLPLILFIGSGIIDTSIKFIQHHYLDTTTFSIFSSTIFFFAAIVGMALIVYNYFVNNIRISPKGITAGIILGIVNYGSIYYLLQALNFNGFESSTVFAINNVAIVLLSTMVGLLFFKEHLFPKNWLGIMLAVISIILISITIY